MEGSKYGDIFQEREQKRHQDLQANLFAIKYVQLYTKIITTRLEKKLDENQPREQAGFRSKYSTTDHIHAINQLKEKCREYNIPLCVTFVDYGKAFDSVQTQSNIDIIAITRNRRCVHRNPERHNYIRTAQ